MRYRSYMAAGALALIPLLALAGQAATPPATQPMFVNFNGQAVPVQAKTEVVQTATGPMQVRTWSWHSPQGGASFEVQTSTGGEPPALALRQMQAAEYQIQMAQTQMAAMQRQMAALQQTVFGNVFTMPTPQAVVFALPSWVMPAPFSVVAPAQHAAPAIVAPPHSPALKT